jgi:cell division protein FtsZ
MIATGLSGVEFVVANTDAQALAASPCEHRIQLGVNLTEGLGAGSKPEIGQAAAEEAIEEIRSQISGSHMVFIAAGMGGGTGTGAAAVIARLAKELDILTVAIVTKPFHFEGTRRMRIADAGVAELRKYVDTLIVIPNQNLFRIANERTTFAEAFILADQVLYSGIACIVDLIVKEGLINLDFADVRTVLVGMGTAMMGTGEASGEGRAVVAAEEAITNPLLDELTLRGAKGLLVSIIGGRDLTLYEVDEAASRVRQEVDPEANIIVGATFDDSMADRVRVSIVASGMANTLGADQRPAGAPTDAAHHPQHAYHPQHHPHQGRGGGEDLAHVLSRALGDPQSGQPADPGRQPHRPNAEWRAPGGVMIEEGLGSMGIGGAPPPLPMSGQGHPPSGPQPTFAPEPPQDVRRGQRRVPSLEEFPEVGQREYRSKTNAGQSNPQPARRPSLLERLTGRTWGANQPSTRPYPQAGRGTPQTGPTPHQTAGAQAVPPTSEDRPNDEGQVSENKRTNDRRRG